MATNTTTKTNRYAADCATCGTNVPAGAGVLGSRARGGRWTVTCGTCPTTPAMPRRRCSGDVHGPGDDECLGARCVQVTRARREASIRYERDHGRGTCARHGNDLDAAFCTGCWECDVEADVAKADREDGRPSARRQNVAPGPGTGRITTSQARAMFGAQND